MFALARRCFVVDAQAAGRPIDLKPAIVAYAGVPLVGPSGHVLGALAAVDDTPRDWSNVERGILEDLGRAASGVLRLHVTRQAALRDLRLLEADVAVDAATGALSDNGFRVRLEAESPRAHRFGHSVAVVCAAIVDLAAFSDRHGRPAAAELVEDLAQTWRSSVRAYDALALPRWRKISPVGRRPVRENGCRPGRAIGGRRAHRGRGPRGPRDLGRNRDR